jgi:hypothetical protein
METALVYIDLPRHFLTNGSVKSLGGERLPKFVPNGNGGLLVIRWCDGSYGHYGHVAFPSAKHGLPIMAPVDKPEKFPWQN